MTIAGHAVTPRKIRKELIARFPQELERRLPQFQRHTEKCDDPIWAWQLAPNLTFFVMLQPRDNKDQFFVEIDWSDDGKFPIDAPSSRRPKVEVPQWRLRLAELWATGPVSDAWEIVPDETDAESEAKEAALERGDITMLEYLRKVPEEEVLPRVAPLVEDAVQKLIDYGLPLFREVAEHRGIPWPDHEVS